MTKQVVADDQLATFSRRTWELQRRISEGSLDPVRVNLALQQLIEGSGGDTKGAASFRIGNEFDWHIVLRSRDIDAIKTIVSTYVFGYKAPYNNLVENFLYLEKHGDAFNKEIISMIRQETPETLRFPASLLNYLERLQDVLAYTSPRDYVYTYPTYIDFLDLERDHKLHICWAQPIGYFGLPIPVLEVIEEEDGWYEDREDKRIIAPEVLEAIGQELEAVDNQNGFAFSHDRLRVTHKNKEYLVLSADLTCGPPHTCIAPIECFDLDR